jgi:hypothetical protein
MEYVEYAEVTPSVCGVEHIIRSGLCEFSYFFPNVHSMQKLVIQYVEYAEVTPSVCAEQTEFMKITVHGRVVFAMVSSMNHVLASFYFYLVCFM